MTYNELTEIGLFKRVLFVVKLWLTVTGLLPIQRPANRAPSNTAYLWLWPETKIVVTQSLQPSVDLSSNKFTNMYVRSGRRYIWSHRKNRPMSVIDEKVSE